MALNYDASTGILKINSLQNEAGTGVPILPLHAYDSSQVYTTSNTFSGNSITNFRAYDPTGNITITLDTNWFTGREIIIQHVGSTTTALITLNANSGTIATIYPGTTYRCVPNTTGASSASQFIGLTPITSQWITYTPAVSNIATSSITGKWLRSGGDLQASFQATVSANATGQIQVAIPAGLTIDTTQLPSSTAAVSVIGSATAGQATNFVASVVYFSTTTVAFIGNNSNNVWNAANPAAWANGNTFAGQFKVPISGWSTFKG
jgi:hypothetical protein